MRLVATADLHGNLPEQLPECDLLVIAGDVCPHENHLPRYQRSWLQLEFTQWLLRMRKVTGCDMVIGVAGNHDVYFEAEPSFGYTLPWTYLCDEWIGYNGTYIYGFPWTPGYDDSIYAFHKTEENMIEATSKVPPNVDIVVGHGPPKNLCDLTSERYGATNAGSQAIRDMLCAVQPDLYLCGHIHTGYGWADLPHRNAGNTRICNVALCSDPPEYMPVQTPIVLDIDKETISMPDTIVFMEPR